MNQVEYIIELFGGLSKTARALGTAPNVIAGWRGRGAIPVKWLPVINEAAEEAKLPLDHSIVWEKPASEAS